ncbi:MAG TPA: ABC transporter permease [Dermatophilaceae bacterium]
MVTAARLGWLEIKLLLREPLTLVFSLVLPLIVLFILGGVFGNTPSAPGQQVFYRGVGPMSYYVPAYLALVIASVCVISIPTHLAGYRERGVLKRYRAASLSIWVVAGAELVVAVALSTASAVVLLVAARLGYDFRSPGSVLGVVGVFVVLTLGFTAMGLLLASVAPTARAAQALGLLIWFVMLMLGGAGPPREALSGAMTHVSDATPLWYAVEMMHGPWLGLDPGAAWWVFTGIAVLSAGLARRLFRWE